MFFSLSLLESFPLSIIYIYIFVTFLSVLLISYPVGRYILVDNFGDSLLICSLFSLTIVATISATIVNLSPIFTKHVIIFFYIINILILVKNEKIRKDLKKKIISNKFNLLLIFIIFLLITLTKQSILIEGNQLILYFDDHWTYFLNPVVEMLRSDYFSRLKFLNLYPNEWATFHFFPASLNAVFLLPTYHSGILGIILIKNFYLAIFWFLFFSIFFKKENLTKKKYLNIILLVLFIFISYIIFFSAQTIYHVTTNNFISIISILFITQSIISKKRNEFLIWSIILSISSFKNILITLLLFLYYFYETHNLSIKAFVNKFKNIFILPNILLSILFLFYLASTFYESTPTTPKFHLLGDGYGWWNLSITKNIILNYKNFLIIFLLLFITYLFLQKYIYKKNIHISKIIRFKDFTFLSLNLVIPILCLTIFSLKFFFIDFYNIEKVKLFYNAFIIENVAYYLAIPFVWSIILFNYKSLVRIIFLLIVIIYTFLSMFINNAVILPGFFAVEMMILLYVFYELQNNRKFLITHLFLVAVLFNSMVSDKERFAVGWNVVKVIDKKYNLKFTKQDFKIKDLKNLKEKKYLCPQDIKSFIKDKNTSSALSSLLVIPFYPSSEQLSKKESLRLSAVSRWMVISETEHHNPCTNE